MRRPRSCSADLADNAVYHARAAVKDDRGLWNGSWSGWLTFPTAIAALPAPTITCPVPYTNGSWTSTAPGGDVTCTITATGSGF